MTASILHRATGAALTGGAFLLVIWLAALADSPESFAYAQDLFGTFIGRLVLFGLTLALMQHLASGIRHLLTDAGKLFRLKRNTASAKFTFIFSVVSTVGVWVWAYFNMGAL